MRPGLHNNHSETGIRLAKREVGRAPRVGLKGGRNRQSTLAERLAARTIKTDTCWNVAGCRVGNNGYGQIVVGRDHVGKLIRIYAHRAAWEIANGRLVPDGLEVLHSCDNPRCVNPAHLSVGTHAENIHDALRKGRWTRRRLSDADVAQIRLMAAGGALQREIAAVYGIARNTVSMIVTGRTRTQLFDQPLQPVPSQPEQSDRALHGSAGRAQLIG